MAVSRRSAYFCIELKQFKLKNNEFNFFPTPLGFVCWWCKIYNKNVGTHKSCLQKPVDKKVHGGETLCKNRKERIIQLLRKENITGYQRIDFHLNFMKKNWIKIILILIIGISDAKLIKSFEKIKSFSSYTFSLQLFFMILG